MSPGDWSIAASVMGFLGSLLLFYPGWRVSRSLKLIVQLRALLDRSSGAPSADAPELASESTLSAEQQREAGSDPDRQTDHDPGPELVEILEDQVAAWRALEHWLLIGGIALIALSFAADLFLVKLAE